MVSVPPQSLIRRPWAVVGIFWLCLVVATVDRQLISITGKAVQGDLHLSDSQLGFIQGPAFALCAAFGGLPVGWLLDRANRVRVAAICFAFWSISTSLTGLTSSFWTMAAMRGGGAIGEAGVAPAALSIFSELFPPNKVARASSIFLTAPLVGMGLGLFLGGVLLDAFTHAAAHLPGLMRSFRPWQLVFLTAGLPGLLLALILPRVVRDPWHSDTRNGIEPTAEASARTEFARVGRTLVLFTLGMTALVLILYVQISWLPMRFLRSFEVSPSEAGLIIGPTYVVASLVGAGLAGWLSGMVPPDRVLVRVIDVVLAAALLLLAPLLLADLSETRWIASASFFLGMMLLGMALSLASVPVQLLVSRQRRAQSLALMTISFNVAGGGLGPVVAGMLSDRLAGHANAIGRAMALASSGGALVAVLLLLLVRQRMLRASVAAADQTQPAS